MNEYIRNRGQPFIKFKVPHFAGTKSENIRCFFSKFEKVIAYYEIEEKKIGPFGITFREKCFTVF